MTLSLAPLPGAASTTTLGTFRWRHWFATTPRETSTARMTLASCVWLAAVPPGTPRRLDCRMSKFPASCFLTRLGSFMPPLTDAALMPSTFRLPLRQSPRSKLHPRRRPVLSRERPDGAFFCPDGTSAANLEGCPGRGRVLLGRRAREGTPSIAQPQGQVP